jgi:hypothetical protein
MSCVEAGKKGQQGQAGHEGPCGATRYVDMDREESRRTPERQESPGRAGAWLLKYMHGIEYQWCSPSLHFALSVGGQAAEGGSHPCQPCFLDWTTTCIKAGSRPTLPATLER